MGAPKRNAVDDQTLAVSVEKRLAGDASYAPLAGPDMRFDNAVAEEIVEGREREINRKRGGRIRRHGGLRGVADRRGGEPAPDIYGGGARLSRSGIDKKRGFDADQTMAESSSNAIF